MTAPTPRRRRAALGAGLAAIVATGTLGAGFAVSAQAASGFAFDTRVEGATRIETAVSASKALYPADGSATDVVIVSQFSIVDGLTAAYIAGLKNAPILYTQTDSMPAASSAELERLGAKNVWIVGGTTVVSQKLQDSWDDAGYETARYGGADRYETAAEVATVQAADVEPERVFIASGVSPADALAVGPISWARNHPILLTRPDRVPDATAAALAELGSPNRTILGGETVVSAGTGNALGGTVRLGGADRQATATIVAEDAVANERFTFENVALVGGNDQNAADALVAAPLAGSTGTAIVFAKGSDAVGATTAAYLKKHAANQSGTGYVFGGTSAVTQKAADEASAAAQ